MITSEIQLYDMLKNKLGEKEAEALMGFIDVKSEEKIQLRKDVFATKEDVANTKADIIKWMFVFWVGQLAAVAALLKLIH